MNEVRQAKREVRLGVKLSLAFLLLFGVVGLAFGYGMSRLVWEAMEDEWDQELRACFESGERVVVGVNAKQLRTNQRTTRHVETFSKSVLRVAVDA